MKTNRTAIWAGLVLILSMTTGCPKTKKAGFTNPFGRKYHIHLRKGTGKCDIDIPKLTLWRADKPTVEWKSDDPDNAQYTMYFASATPFDTGDITTNDGPKQLRQDVQPGSYLYSVLGPDKKECLPATDPGVYIK